MEFTTQAAGLVAESGEQPNVAERFVARSFYQELRETGYTPMELLAVSIELIGLVTQDLPERR